MFFKREKALVLIVLAVVMSSRVRGLAEDVQLRSRAVALLDRAKLVSQIHGIHNVRTEVSFAATAKDGSLQGGTYTRVRGMDGSLRQESHFGDFTYLFTVTGVQGGISATPGEIPYALRKIWQLVPYGAGAFDETDVIEDIRDSSYGGLPAVCAEFVTVTGEKRLPGEACVDRANGTLLELRSGDRLWEYSGYFDFEGALLPSHIVYRETNFSLNADLKLTALDRLAEDTFIIPEDWRHTFTCHAFQPAIERFAPQPPGTGAPLAAVIEVSVSLWIDAQGKVLTATTLKPTREDLDQEAEKLARQWIFEPAACDGKPVGWQKMVVMQFQGR